MLEMIGYDLHQPRNQRHLRRGIRACGHDSHNLPYAPWLVDTEMKTTEVLGALDHHLKRHDDRLLVLNLAGVADIVGPELRPSAALLNRGAATEAWLESRLDLSGRHNRSGVLGISYTLHGASGRDYTRLAGAIRTLFPDHCKPVNALWFVATEHSPHTVREALAERLPNPEIDELLVVEIPRRQDGTAHLRTRDRLWLDGHDMLVH